MSGDSHEGGCVCGAVRLRTQGKPVSVGLCHCLDCRKAHSAAFAAFATFPADAVTFFTADGNGVSEANVGYWDNGRGYKRHFCRACGSRLYGTQEESSDLELHIGLFDQPNLWAPTYELWVTRRENWLGHIDGSPTRYEADKPVAPATLG